MLWAILTPILIIASLILFYLLVFKRDPKRIIPSSGILSPADGRIVSIVRTKDTSTVTMPKGILGKVMAVCSDVAEECAILSIMMTPFNAHFQRSPIEGKVIAASYTRGKFMNAIAKKDLSILENEKNEILIKGKSMKIKVIQVAGFAARRIKCFVSEGQQLKRGQKIGFIDLGSQVILILPSSVNVLVRKGDNVKGGETVIAN